MRIIATDQIPEEVLEEFESGGENEVLFRTGLSEEEIIKIIPDFEAIVVRSMTQVTRKIIEAGKNLRVIGRAGSGTDNIDKEAASEHGILVVNAPTGNLISVAEMVIGFFIALSRTFIEAHATLQSNKWEKKTLGKKGRELDEKTLGIIGFGKIGQLVAERAKGFRMKILTFDPVVSSEFAAEQGAELVSLENLLKKSDFITIHVPLIPQTKGMISEKEFSLMKPEAVLVNCARGGVVDEKALLSWLKNNPGARSAADVFEKEPATDNPLLALDNFMGTPHLGASTREAQIKVGLQLADQVLKALNGEMVEHIVNFPSKPTQSLPEESKLISLAENLGKIASQVVEGGIEEITLKVFGNLADFDTKMLMISSVMGALSVRSSRKINIVNATRTAEEKGISIKEKKDKEPREYKNEIVVKIKSSKGEAEVSGAIVGDEIRFVGYKEAEFNFPFEKCILFVWHQDQPGMIGKIGAKLGENGINITRMEVGPLSDNGMALMLISIDQGIEKIDSIVSSIENKDGFGRLAVVNL